MDKFIQHKYGDGFLGDWDEMYEMADPDYSKRLYKTIKENNLLPENMDGFVFLSPSSHQASKEIELAEIINGSLGGVQLNKKPMFIASDFLASIMKKGILSQVLILKKSQL